MIYNYKKLEKAIEKSGELMYIDDESEDDGAMPCSEETWLEAVQFLRILSSVIYNNYNKIIDIPKINATPFGGISLHWTEDTYRVLMTVWPVEYHKSITFYGDDGFWKNKITGTTKSNDIDEKLLLWFANNMPKWRNWQTQGT